MKTKTLLKTMLLTVTAAALLTGTTVLADEKPFHDSSTYRAEDGSICVDFGEIQVFLPSYWSGLCQMAPSESEVSFYQTKSRKLYEQELGYPAAGLLFSVNRSEDLDFLDHPAFEILGSSDGYTYYITYPTDVQGYVESSEAMTEYGSMCEDLEWIKENIWIRNADPIVWDDYYSDSEYILPTSSDEYLIIDDIDHMDADELQMAINEIYARHGRKFVMEHVQDYFDSCSWYEGTIEAEDFNVNVMNEYESQNISILVKRMNEVKANPDLISGSPYDITHQEKDCYGMIIESGDGYFQVRQQDGSVIQFWYDYADLADMALTASDLSVGATVSVIYTTESYQAYDILVF